MTVLKNAGVTHYTKFPYLHGEGGHSEPHLDTQIWPGSNTALLISTEEPTIKKIVSELKELKEKNLKEGLKAFVLPLEEVL
jgi:hypothetical protein